MGVYRSEPDTQKHTLKGSNGKISYCSVEMQGWRKNMQDAAIHELDLGDGNSLFSVFDGHGGHEVSQCVKQIFPKILKDLPQYGQKKYVTALDLAFKKVDQVLNSQIGSQKLKQIRSKNPTSQNSFDDKIVNGTGCTANVILITPQKYIIANSGDSRSVLSRSSQAVPFSEDHKPENQIESKRIYNAGGNISMGRVNGGLNLSRSFGDFDYKQNKSLGYDQQMITCKPDIKQVNRQINNDEFIILGCDGIWQRYVDNNQGMIDLIKKDLGKREVSQIMEDLLDFLLAKDTRQGLGCDNMTAILITLK